MASELVEKISSSKIKDYSYVVVFFLMFSFFVIFAIRPNIITAVNLQKELAELKELNDNYEQAILHIINVQTVLEKYRNDYHLLADALPVTPQVNKVIDDLQIAASSSGLILKSVDIDEVNLKEINEKKLRQFKVKIQTDSNFDTIRKFYTDLNQQRRLKTVDILGIDATEDSSPSGILDVDFEVVGYYL